MQAAARALDTAASFAREKNPSIDLQDFYVGGGSKVTRLIPVASDRRIQLQIGWVEIRGQLRVLSTYWP